MRPLALHHQTVLEVPPTELLAIAHELGCQHVCVFVHLPLPDVPFKAVTPEMVPELRARMAATGVTVAGVEFFVLSENVDVESFRSAVELGAQLGGRRLIVVSFDTVASRAAENLARTCDLAAEYDMQVGLEFTGVTPGCTSLESAANLIRLASRPNAGFGVDCLHLVRTGGTPTDVAAMPAELFGYFQICDGPDLVVRSDYSAESRERMVPGEGVFPIAEILDALPAATPVDVEVPSIIGSQRGVPALERARRSVSAARELLDRAQPTR